MINLRVTNRGVVDLFVHLAQYGYIGKNDTKLPDTVITTGKITGPLWSCYIPRSTLHNLPESGKTIFGNYDDVIKKVKAIVSKTRIPFSTTATTAEEPYDESSRVERLEELAKTLGISSPDVFKGAGSKLVREYY